MGYDFYDMFSSSSAGLLESVVNYGSRMLIALAVIVIGWMVANIVKKVVVKMFVTFKINEALDAAGLDKLAEKAGYPLKAGVFVGTLIKWFVLAVFFMVALNIMALEQVTAFMREVVIGYLPQVIVAVLILMVAALVANAAATAVEAAVRAGGSHKPGPFKKLTYYAIMTFAVLAALNQVEVAPELVQTLFAGMVFALSLALGLSFGLGGRDSASRFIDKMTRE